MQRLGCRLLIAAGQPEDVIPDLLDKGGTLAFQREDTSEEQDVEHAVLQKLPRNVRVCSHWTHTLLHRDDLGWDPQESLPLPFGKYFHGTCSHVLPRRELPSPRSGELPPAPTAAPTGAEGSWHAVRPTAAAIEAAMASGASACKGPDFVKEARELAKCGDVGEPAIDWRGGEAAGLARLSEYATPAGLGTYHRTRNQLHGRNHSSHLSPWLANGCLSPRTVYWRAKEYERTHAHSEKDKRFDHVQKFVFELCWRDYFRFYCAHEGRHVFFLGGPANRMRHWTRDLEVEARWKEGRTGVPLVDALMRELRYTGYIANRGRYVVASYLVHYLGIDWRVGADWFEHLLLDHDVCSNYGEWTSMANVAAVRGARTPLGLKGRGPTGGRRPGARGDGGDPWAKGAETGDAIFDPWEQAAQYDRSEEYVRCWVPELRHAPPGVAHRPGDLDRAARAASRCPGYPEPLAVEVLARTDRRVGAVHVHASGSRAGGGRGSLPAAAPAPDQEQVACAAGGKRFRRGGTARAGAPQAPARVRLTPGPGSGLVHNEGPEVWCERVDTERGYPAPAAGEARQGGSRRWRPKRYEARADATMSDAFAGG